MPRTYDEDIRDDARVETRDKVPATRMKHSFVMMP